MQNEKSSFAPGMTMPVIAGEQYTLKDANGESLVIEGRDDPLTVEFIEAFRKYTYLRAIYDADHEQSVRAWHECLDRLETLPARFKESRPFSLPVRPL